MIERARKIRKLIEWTGGRHSLADPASRFGEPCSRPATICRIAPANVSGINRNQCVQNGPGRIGSGGPSQPIPPDFIRTLRRISGGPGEFEKKHSNQWANKEVRQGWFVNVLDIWRTTRDPVPYQRVSKRSLGKGERPNGELVDTLCAAHTASRRTRSAGRNGESCGTSRHKSITLRVIDCYP